MRARAVSRSTTATPCRVETEEGGEVIAREVVIATHYPTLDRGGFFARLSAERSYAIGLRTRGPVLHGMFLSTESPSHSVRATPFDGGELLIVGGESHKTGTGGDTTEPLRAARGVGARAVRRRRRGVPLVGAGRHAARRHPVRRPASPASRRIWTASGFKKWGMTNGAAAAIMLADLIEERPNPWTATFDANRFKPLASARKLLKETASVGAHFFGDRLSGPDLRSLDELAPGEGALVAHDGDTVAAYRDEDGHGPRRLPRLHPHVLPRELERRRAVLGLPVPRPRFAPDGTVIQGPAVKPSSAGAPRPRVAPAPCRRACTAARSSRAARAARPTR